MSDVIKDAKGLAELKVPPLRAEITVHEDEDPRYTDDCLVQIVEKDDEYSIWYEEEHGGYEHGKLHFAHVFAAAPELAQALAEETYFYGVQVWMGGRWIMMLTRDHGTSLMHRGKWFEHKHEAEECAAKWNHDTPTRIVRQRRSPVEVINE